METKKRGAWWREGAEVRSVRVLVHRGDRLATWTQDPTWSTLCDVNPRGFEWVLSGDVAAIAELLSSRRRAVRGVLAAAAGHDKTGGGAKQKKKKKKKMTRDRPTRHGRDPRRATWTNRTETEHTAPATRIQQQRSFHHGRKIRRRRRRRQRRGLCSRRGGGGRGCRPVVPSVGGPPKPTTASTAVDPDDDRRGGDGVQAYVEDNAALEGKAVVVYDLGRAGAHGCQRGRGRRPG